MERVSPRTRFSLRSLCLAFVLLAILFAVIGHSIREAERQRYVIRHVHELGGMTWFADEYNAEEPSYNKSRLEPRDFPSFEQWLPDGYSRRIIRIDLDYRNDVPPWLLLEASRLKHLKELAVSPAVAKTPEWLAFQRRRPDCAIVAKWNMTTAPVTTVTSPRELAAAIAQGKSVLFMDGGLGINVSLSRDLFPELAAEWHAQNPNSDVRFLRVTFQRDPTPEWLAALQWQIDQGVDPDEIEIHGASGRILWIQDGKLVRYDQSLRRTTVAAVVKRTAEAFAERVP